MASKRALEVKEKLRRGEVVYSAWLTFNDVGVAEVLAGSGFDIILVDTEHTSITLENLHHCLAAMKAWDPVTIVRVPGHDPSGIKRVLDIGADGVIGPMTMDAEQCARLVASCKYAPAGRRGFGPRRASDYFRDMSGYIANTDAATFVIPQIEHVEAAGRALEIASVPGVDALCLGPMDMSATAGLLGQLEHPTMLAAMDKVFDAARATKLAVCMGFYLPPEQQPRWVAKGARLVIAADDLANLRNGVSRDLAEARRLLAR
ncbi:MAG: HpcH/HpaI aldolase family protein [Alphaproteobacteria bacterium]|jgi:2-keto-3-deoxy-L-rhamnonate aldolase RhmA